MRCQSLRSDSPTRVSQQKSVLKVIQFDFFLLSSSLQFGKKKDFDFSEDVRESEEGLTLYIGKVLRDEVSCPLLRSTSWVFETCD